MDVVNPQTLQGDEISLRELLGVLWANRWLAVCVTLLFALAAAAAVWLAPTKYTAEIIVSPASDTSSGNQLGRLGSLASQFGGIASLAGISVGGDSKKAESIAVLQSSALTQKYIQNNDLLPVLYEKRWNAKERRWNISDPKKKPTLWKANEDFKKKVRAVTSDTKTGLVTMSITWKDPVVAAKWANDLVKMTNEYLRAKAIAESERNIAYLNAQAARTEVVAVRQAIYSILESEISKAMLARGSEEYAFKVIDPAIAPEKPSSPKPVLWIVGGFIGGLAFSVLIAFVRVAWSRG